MMKQLILAVTLVFALGANAQNVQKKATKIKKPTTPMVAPAEPVTPAGQVAPTAETTITSPTLPAEPTPAPTSAPVMAPPPVASPAPTSSDSGIGYFGLNLGVGVPYLTQVGLNYLHSSNMFSVELGYSALNATLSDVTVGLNKTELSVRWHPFMGAFYLGVGFGQSTMSGKSKDTINGQSVEAKVEIKSSTMTPQIGWMWGVADGGFFFGMDIGIQNPSGVKSTFTTNADLAAQATADYKKLEEDTRDQADKLGETAIPLVTLLRFGYLF